MVDIKFVNLSVYSNKKIACHVAILSFLGFFHAQCRDYNNISDGLLPNVTFDHVDFLNLFSNQMRSSFIYNNIIIELYSYTLLISKWRNFIYLCIWNIDDVKTSKYHLVLCIGQFHFSAQPMLFNFQVKCISYVIF